MNEFDVVVIGGGAAGLTAALVLTRARRSVLVVDTGRPRNAPAAHMHGFLSRDGLPPSMLLNTGRDEVLGYGGEFADARVDDITIPDDNAFHVSLDDGGRVRARRVLVATGLRDELPDIPGLKERWARDVLHCPYCHGYEVRDQQLGVLGDSAEATGYAQIVRQWSGSVTYLARTGTLTAGQLSELTARGISVVEGEVTRVVTDDDRLSGVELAGGRVLTLQAVFLPPRLVPNNELLIHLGCDVDDDGWPVRDFTGRTTVAGVWVAGNVANRRAQVITAAGEGSAAAIAMNADLVEEEVRQAVTNQQGQFL